MKRRLVRSKNDKILAGVCGGIAEYFDIDPTIVRLGLVISIIAGPGILAYIAAIFIIPEDDGSSYRPSNFFEDDNKVFTPNGYDPEKDFSTVMGDKNNGLNRDPEKSKTFIGICLIILGAVFLAKQFIRIDLKLIIPALLIGIGLLIVFKGGRRLP
ncbi:MAG TPA: PspC domain-containing protein [Acetivibrio sp.]|jgi:phage shock protein C|nr:PspC domain-containing protein [Clostridium sp.]HOQ36299.1 PspC domain-containing protein [Acetivibrio sp.]HPT91335.1 PspC domain-containing protein [Acetivibrio sp.]HQA56859.1 PspC domain-containing protein [Acetivibrio sp.]